MPITAPLPRPLDLTWEWSFPFPPERVWPQVSDTDTFNRDAGLPPVIREPSPEANAESVGIIAKAGPFKLHWRESRFEWLSPQRFSVTRRYAGGPLRQMQVEVKLRDLGAAGTALSYHIAILPRWTILRPVLLWALRGIIRGKFDKAFRAARKRMAVGLHQEARMSQASKALPPAFDIRNNGNESSQKPEITFASGGRERLRARLGVWAESGADALEAESLGLWLKTADDAEVMRMRPYALAAKLGLARQNVLKLCLSATRAGLLEMRWEPICPFCRGPQGVADRLGGLRATVHCDSCHIDFKTDLDRSIEVTFRAHPALREPASALYCVGSPQRTPHILMQARVAPGEEAVAHSHLRPGRYRLRSPGMPGGQFILAEAGGRPLAAFAASARGWSRIEEKVGLEIQIRLRNDLAESAYFIWERMAYADDAAMAAEVVCLQSFHDLFGAETLRVGEEISVGSLAFLFTDLKGSTRMYREVGDAKAFGLVMDHFAVLQKCVDDAGGAMVKTIGDAVMAVFTHPEAAVRAALLGQAGLRQAGIDLVLKAGVHCGPCIAVTQNERLDYFGSTLNLAARLLEFCQGGDLVLSQAAARDPGLSAWLDRPEAQSKREDLSVTLRGFEGETHALLRLALADGGIGIPPAVSIPVPQEIRPRLDRPA